MGKGDFSLWPEQCGACQRAVGQLRWRPHGGEASQQPAWPSLSFLFLPRPWLCHVHLSYFSVPLTHKVLLPFLLFIFQMIHFLPVFSPLLFLHWRKCWAWGAAPGVQALPSRGHPRITCQLLSGAQVSAPWRAGLGQALGVMPKGPSLSSPPSSSTASTGQAGPEGTSLRPQQNLQALPTSSHHSQGCSAAKSHPH